MEITIMLPNGDTMRVEKENATRQELVRYAEKLLNKVRKYEAKSNGNTYRMEHKLVKK